MHSAHQSTSSAPRIFQRSILAVILFSLNTCCGLGADEFEAAPIYYSATQPNTPIEVIEQKLSRGDVSLSGKSSKEQLKSLLGLLNVPVSSQVLVFSKTSLQINRIGPRTPRAIYFNDQTYVGYIPNSSTVEIISIDPNIGPVFYTVELPPRKLQPPQNAAVDSSHSISTDDKSLEREPVLQFVRDKGQCLSCHATTRTERVPGMLVRSIFPDKAGRPRSGASSFVTDHSSPFSERWGGWYVTGQHGDMRHMGNVLALTRDDPEDIDRELGANWTNLEKQIAIRNYLIDSSDIIALMILEHQSKVQNLITRANFETRQALHLDAAMNVALERPRDHKSESTVRRINSVANELVRALLFGDEFELANPITGSPVFANDFQGSSDGDSLTKPLKKLNVNNRLFESAVSYLIFSDQFDALPDEVKSVVIDRVISILRGEEAPPGRVLWDSHARETTFNIISEHRPNWVSSTP